MPISASVESFNQLDCIVISDASETPDLLVVLCHGFGAPGDDLADFGPWLMQNSPLLAARCRFVFPAAPLDLARYGMPGARAWWPINMAMLAKLNETQDFSQLTEMTPPGMHTAAEQLHTAINQMQQRWQVPHNRCIIGGFSQGAMVTTCITLRHQFQPALLAILSGTMLEKSDWTRLAKSHPGCPVLQSHGTQDTILPISPALELRDLLHSNRFTVDFIQFTGPHTIPTHVLQRLQKHLEDLSRQDANRSPSRTTEN
ncbi:MAG: alpha/beta hydrolase [Planctomyces sp.]|jgi:phospholipase/carboxylesterase